MTDDKIWQIGLIDQRDDLFTLNVRGSNVATFDGGSISLEEAESSYRTDFYEMEQQRFQLLRRAAYELAQQKIIEAEEKRRAKKLKNL